MIQETSRGLDLDPYFERIGYGGPRTPTLDVLRELQWLHPQSIPFENLDPISGRRVRVDLPSVADKLVRRRRGGYCFEQNTLFAHVLTQLGFRVTPLIARVLWGREPGAVTAQTHMLLRVDLDYEAWLADVGFGNLTLTAPLRMAPGLAQETPHGVFRLHRDGASGAIDLQLGTPEGWPSIYRFTLQRAEWIDFEVANWFTTAHPDSRFTNNLVVCRVFPRSRFTLFNGKLTERGNDGAGVERPIGSADELARELTQRFGIDIEGIDVARVFERVAAPVEG
ncbi:arylamine N-acetyltransferase [Trinickia terrae]|uniref:Arylamine N-acetyltransferase n=1 Tax=Trinickia terrae TaxID=2571161 RepID=A0A4U1IFT2_9BURK|nr:arylamine N-acetyltransferase [Trinickia terrae]TKC92552.1 arylamine N-acetyltransferase [Trinickia terrae]